MNELSLYNNIKASVSSTLGMSALKLNYNDKSANIDTKHVLYYKLCGILRPVDNSEVMASRGRAST